MALPVTIAAPVEAASPCVRATTGRFATPESTRRHSGIDAPPPASESSTASGAARSRQRAASNATPSTSARARCAAVCTGVSPTNVRPVRASHHGARAPPSQASASSPPAPASMSSACCASSSGLWPVSRPSHASAEPARGEVRLHHVAAERAAGNDDARDPAQARGRPARTPRRPFPKTPWAERSWRRRRAPRTARSPAPATTGVPALTPRAADTRGQYLADDRRGADDLRQELRPLEPGPVERHQSAPRSHRRVGDGRDRSAGTRSGLSVPGSTAHRRSTGPARAGVSMRPWPRPCRHRPRLR